MNATAVYTGITYIIPCGGKKLDRAAPARELYIGSMFRHTLENAQKVAASDVEEGRGPARVLILSALHGLVDLDEVLEPYDLRMGEPYSVTAEVLAAQAILFGIDTEVYALLPRPYLARLKTALQTLDVVVHDVYEGCAGIGKQKRVNVKVGRQTRPVEVPAGPGPIVWLGGDVSALWWGIRILVSYDRLRAAKTLPVATAPWVCDSRGFAEIRQHGRWTIAAADYVADLRRYAAQIGLLKWVAPQDWPCGPELFAKTGLDEEQHQRRTTASVVELRTMAPELPVIAVVTGTTPASVLRHIEIYAEAGINLRAEKLVVGVGSLVGLPHRVQADIIRALHDAGLRRLHGFGAKGPVMDLVGRLFESIDSADWSGEARRRAGKCRHGLVTWERNCKIAAQEWGVQQQLRAVRPPAPSKERPTRRARRRTQGFRQLSLLDELPFDGALAGAPSRRY